MFVEKLTKDDILFISKIVLEYVKANDAELYKYFKSSRISYGRDCVSFDFCDNQSEENWIHFYDYELKSNFIYTKKDMYDLTILFKSFMYKKFGQTYIDEMRKRVKEKYNREYDSIVAELDKEISEIVK